MLKRKDSGQARSVHSGQVALIMVLVMTVISAVAVSVAGRSTVETRVQQLTVDSTEALLTAQAGLEQAVSQDAPLTGTTGEGREYTVTRDDGGAVGINTEKIGPGESVEVNLEGGSGITDIKVYWRAAVVGQRPSVFITDVRGDRNVDYAYDTEGAGGFTLVSSGGSLSGVSYDYATPNIPVILGDSSKIHVTVLGAEAFVGVEPVGGVLPAQVTEYRSVADLTSDEASIRYGIEYEESKIDLLPSVFDYVLFSGGSLVQ